MRISRSWLEEFVTTPPAEELDALFELAGVGVEEREGDHFALEITSNRGDLLSAAGLAREIGAMTEARVRIPQVESAERSEAPGFPVEVQDAADCPRYTARLLENITVGPSPDWMQARLLECGVRAVNNVVDITNYVMLELGQPLHAFDADTLNERIIVRRSVDGEKLVTLDEIERTLTPDMLVIADANGAVALAGVMGGAATEVTGKTTRVLLEGANFAPSLVRRGRRALEMTSEASRRYERFVDPNLAARASLRATDLLIKHAGATVPTSLTDIYPSSAPPTKITLRTARCNALLGLKIPSATQASCLTRLGLQIVSQSDTEIEVQVPSFRPDLTLEVDLIEEVARINGYGSIPTTLPRGVNPTAGRSLSQRLEDRAKSALLRCGVHEIITYSLENAAAVTRAGMEGDALSARAVRLRNPLSDDLTQMRTSLRPSLLAVLEKNNKRGARVFEMGKAYLARESTAELPEERRRLAVALMDAPGAKGGLDFYGMKAILETALAEMGAPAISWQAAQTAGLHPGRTASLLIDGQWIGIAGEIHPEVAERYDITTRAYMAELDFEALVLHLSLARQYEPLPRFPHSDRDLALVVKADLTASQIESVVSRAAGPFAREVRTFDVYTGSPIPEGHKSLALSLRFRADDRTLTDTEIDAALESARAAAIAQLGAALR